RQAHACSAPAACRRTSSVLLGHQTQCDRVDAVALIGGGVVALTGEHVAQVAVAARAQHLDPLHAQAEVVPQQHRVGVLRVVERRPPAVAFELLVAGEQLRPAGAAGVDTLGLGVLVLTGERLLGARFAEHVVLLRAELLAPFDLGLDHFRRGTDDWLHDLPSQESADRVPHTHHDTEQDQQHHQHGHRAVVPTDAVARLGEAPGLGVVRIQTDEVVVEPSVGALGSARGHDINGMSACRGRRCSTRRGYLVPESTRSSPSCRITRTWCCSVRSVPSVRNVTWMVMVTEPSAFCLPTALLDHTWSYWDQYLRNSSSLPYSCLASSLSICHDAAMPFGKV